MIYDDALGGGDRHGEAGGPLHRQPPARGDLDQGRGGAGQLQVEGGGGGWGGGGGGGGGRQGCHLQTRASPGEGRAQHPRLDQLHRADAGGVQDGRGEFIA